MPTTLTLKNIPDALYAQLKAAAQSNRRSLNSEALICLEAVLLPPKPAADARLARARALREGLAHDFAAPAVDTFKREGRA